MRAKNEFKFISEAYKNVHEEETDEQIRRRGGHGDKDDPEWKRQMDNRPEVSPEEVERLKNRKPKPQSYSKKHPKSEKDEYHPGYGKSEGEEDDDDIDLEFNREENRKDLAKPIHSWMHKEDDVISQLDVEAAARERLRKKYGEDNEEPRRGITGKRSKPDALVSARQAGAKHKPYVSFFVDNDGRKIAAVLGSDGKIARDEEGNIKKWPARNKKEAEAWMSANYENI